jgi:hypothetical protein
MMFPLLSTGSMLTGEFASLEEPTEVVEVATTVGLLANGPERIGYERRRVPKDPKQNLKLAIYPCCDRGC